MDATTFNTISQHLIESERPREWPYLDIKGNITIGVGFHTETEDAFLKLPLTNKDTGRPATDAEKHAAWKTLKDKAAEVMNDGGHSKKAVWFEELTAVRMPQSEQDRKLKTEIETRSGKIKNDIGEDAWNRLTAGQKAVAIDVHYANEAKWSEFKKFKAALKAGDAEGIARESTFYTDKGKQKRDMRRLERNWATAKGIDIETAKRELADQLAKAPENQTQNTSEPGRRFETPPRKPGHTDAGGGNAETEKLAAALMGPEDPLDEIMAKTPADLTEGEVMQVMDARRKARTVGERERLFKVEQAFYNDHYGTQPAKRGFDGRLVAAEPVRPVNRTPVAAPGTDALKELAKAIAKPIRLETSADVTRALQSGLNILSGERLQRDDDEKPVFRLLKEDGVAGPKTSDAFKIAARDWGGERMKEGLALGRFKRFAEESKALNLDGHMRASFGPLFRKPADTGGKSTPEGFGLQGAINDLGRVAIEESFQPIKEDGWIGPKTQDAFGRVLRGTGADAFTRGLGRSLGFFG